MAVRADLVNAGWYRVFGLVSLIATFIVTLAILQFGVQWRDKASPGEASGAMLTFLALYLGPASGLTFAYLSVADWKKFRIQKVFKWQARFSLGLLLVTCFWTLGGIGHAVFWAEYEKEINTEGAFESDYSPCTWRLDSRVGQVCLSLGFLMPLSLSVGLFGGSASD